jgi:mRNA-degrading endonuclease toxin of MazEF toxin-antitoxin module
VCVPLTTNTKWANVPGNVLLPPHVTNLPQDSVANAALVISIDKELLVEHVGKLSRAKLELVLSGLDAVLGI